MLGSWVGPYQVVEKLGEGGMGQVYLARDPRLHRKVALKTFAGAKADSEEKEIRALHEARAAADLSHPNIAAIHDVIEAGGRTCIVMEFVPGRTLQSMLDQGPLPVAKATDLGAQMAGAVAYAHAAGVIHRDLKPSNVIVTPDGRAKILDFGLAQTFSGKSWPAAGAREDALFGNRDRGPAGTPAYMAPELFNGARASESSDVYSLGVVLFEMLTGSRPYGHHDLGAWPEVLAKSEVPSASERNADVPVRVSHVVSRAMAMDPAQRYGSAVELLRALRSLSSATTVSAPALVVPSPRFGPRRRLLVAALAIAVIAIAAAIVPRVVGRRSNLPSPPPDASGWYERGSRALREGAFLTAAKCFEQAVALHDPFPLAHARLAEARAELDDDRAKDSLLYVQTLVPDLTRLPEEDGLYLRAIRAMVTRRFTDAVGAYRHIAAAHPEAAFPQLDLGRALAANEQLVEAARTFEKASVLDPQSPAAYLGMGSAYGSLQEPARALDAYERAASLYHAASNLEGVTEVALRRGDLLRRLARLSEARGELERALKLATETGNLGQRVACLLGLAHLRATQGATAEAKRTAQEAMELAKGMPAVAGSGLIDLGNVFFIRREFSDAGRYFQLALESARRQAARRTEARALLALGSLELEMDNPAAGLAYVNEALPFYRSNGYRREEAVAQQLVGLAYRVRGQFDRAIRAFEEQLVVAKALNHGGLAASAHDQLAFALVEAERFVEALPHADAAIRDHDARGALAYRADSLVTKAQALARLGRSREASLVVEELRRADLNALGGSALESIVSGVAAEIAFGEGRFRRARELYRRGLVQAPSDNVASRMILTTELARAELATGDSREAGRLAALAFGWRRQQPEPGRFAGIALGVSEVQSRLGEFANALPAALEAAEACERNGQRVSWLRASLVVAHDAERSGKPELAAAHRSRAKRLVKELEAEFGNDWRSMLIQKWLPWPGELEIG